MSQRSDQFTLAAFAFLLCNVQNDMSTQYDSELFLTSSHKAMHNADKYTVSIFNRVKPQGGDAYGLATF